MLPAPGMSRTLHVLECAPCAIARWLRERQQPWSRTSADLAVDAAVGAVVLAGAHEVLVPVDLATFIGSFTPVSFPPLPSTSLDGPLLHQWNTLLEDERLVLLVRHTEVEAALTRLPQYRKLCVPVPAGPLIARLGFDTYADTFYSEALPHLTSVMASAGAGVEWRAWVRSALTCRYEGTYVPPIRVSENTARLLRDEEGACTSVLWEEAVQGLTSRWLETATKTALSCGVPTSALGFAFASGAGGTRLLSKAIDMGVGQFATCSLPNEAVFDTAEGLVTAAQVAVLTAGWNDAHSAMTANDEDLLEDASSYVDALCARWSSFVQPSQPKEAITTERAGAKP